MFTEIKASLIVDLLWHYFFFLYFFTSLFSFMASQIHIYQRKTSRYDPNYCVTAGLRGSFLFDYEKRSLKQELLGHDKRSNL